MVGTDWCPHKQIARVALCLKHVVVEEDTVCVTPVLREDRNQPGRRLISKVFDQSPDVRFTHKDIDFLFAFHRDRLNLRAESLLKSLEELSNWSSHSAPFNRSAAPLRSRNNGSGIQKPMRIITEAKPTIENFFHRQVSPGGRPGSDPRTKLAMWMRNPEKIATRNV